jgi:hypothetical protein
MSTVFLALDEQHAVIARRVLEQHNIPWQEGEEVGDWPADLPERYRELEAEAARLRSSTGSSELTTMRADLGAAQQQLIVAELVSALKSVVSVADEAHREWDADNDSRVGKILLALAGGLKGYRPDITKIHETLAKHDGGEMVRTLFPGRDKKAGG